jgi:hypothetical protein
VFILQFELVLPLSTVGIPFLILTILLFLDKLDSACEYFFIVEIKSVFKGTRIVGSMFFVVGSSHSTLNSVSMLLMTKPYRQALFGTLFNRVKPKNTTIMVVTTKSIK